MQPENDAPWEIPSWLERRRIEDGLLAVAYEETPNEWRVAIKTAIAAAHFLSGNPLESKSAGAANGLFSWRWTSAPASLCAIFAPADLSAAAFVTAAALAPLLAGVENILWVMRGASPHRNQLVSLELCGLENIFLVNKDHEKRLREELPQQCRVLTIAHPASVLPDFHKNSGAFVSRLDACPQTYLPEPQFFREDILRFALGATPLSTGGQQRLHWDAIYATEEFRNRSHLQADLWLGPGLELFWAFPHLNADFFTNKSWHMRMFN